MRKKSGRSLKVQFVVKVVSLFGPYYYFSARPLIILYNGLAIAVYLYEPAHVL